MTLISMLLSLEIFQKVCIRIWWSDCVLIVSSFSFRSLLYSRMCLVHIPTHTWEPDYFISLPMKFRWEDKDNPLLFYNFLWFLYFHYHVCLWFVIGVSFQLGYSVLSRGSYAPHPSRRPLSLLHQSFQSLESIMKCVQMSWMVILVGPACVGKTSLVQLLAQLTGHTLKIMAMNSAMDTTELLGGFEQVTCLPSHCEAKHKSLWID